MDPFDFAFINTFSAKHVLLEAIQLFLRNRLGLLPTRKFFGGIGGRVQRRTLLLECGKLCFVRFEFAGQLSAKLAFSGEFFAQSANLERGGRLGAELQ